MKPWLAKLKVSKQVVTSPVTKLDFSVTQEFDYQKPSAYRTREENEQWKARIAPRV